MLTIQILQEKPAKHKKLVLMKFCISFVQLSNRTSGSTAPALQLNQHYYQFALDIRKRFSCTYICSQKEKKMVCEVPISIEKQKHLLGALRGSLGSLTQHHRPQLVTPAFGSTQGVASRKEGETGPHNSPCKVSVFIKKISKSIFS